VSLDGDRYSQIPLWREIIVLLALTWIGTPSRHDRLHPLCRDLVDDPFTAVESKMRRLRGERSQKISACLNWWELADYKFHLDCVLSCRARLESRPQGSLGDVIKTIMNHLTRAQRWLSRQQLSHPHGKDSLNDLVIIPIMIAAFDAYCEGKEGVKRAKARLKSLANDTYSHDAQVW